MWSMPVRMKKITLQMIDDDAPTAAMTLAGMALMHPLENQDEPVALDEFPAEAYFAVYHRLQARYGKIIQFVQGPLTPPQASTELVSIDELQALNQQLKTLWSKVSELEERLRRESEKLIAIRQLSNSLGKFGALDLDLGRLRRPGQFLEIVAGTVPSENFYQLKRALSLVNFMADSFYSSEGIEHVIVFGSAQHQQDVQELLKSADFRMLSIPQEFSGSPTELRTDIDNQIIQIETSIRGLKSSRNQLLNENMPTLNRVNEVLIQAKPYASLSMVLKGKGSLVSLQGWVPADRDQEIKQRLQQTLSYPFHYESAEPETDEYNSVPSLLKQSWLIAPFQSLVRNFGIPGYAEIDPSALFALTYVLMFGMMFGDVGHGAVILLLAILMWRRLPAVGIAGSLAGLSSIVFGFVYGSVFGYEQVLQPLWMSPMHDPTQILLVAIIWGAGFLIMANLLSIKNHFASADIDQAIYSSRGIAGLLFYLAGIFVGYQQFSNNGIGWFEALLLSVPLLVSLQFQWRHSSGGIVERLLVVAIEGLEQIISNVSGTLSFLRVAAFSLNHIALAAAVFAIAAMLDGVGHWLTIVFGNIFIIVLEGAIVAIQCLRLEYYEGFSRFFSGKGKAFTPLKIAR